MDVVRRRLLVSMLTSTALAFGVRGRVWAEPTQPPGTTTTERGGYASMPATSGGLSWTGQATGEANLRRGPTTEYAVTGELKSGDPVKVLRWISGEEVEASNPVWADLGSARYVYSTNITSNPLPATPPPVAKPLPGRWLDMNVTLQILTAYVGARPMKSFLVSSGRPDWPTPLGNFEVLRRVANETMDGTTLVGQGPDGTGDTYYIENVLWTQYFDTTGDALHTNYWSQPDMFGIPTSHGCIGMPEPDARWIWNFATIGTPLITHQ